MSSRAPGSRVTGLVRLATVALFAAACTAAPSTPPGASPSAPVLTPSPGPSLASASPSATEQVSTTATATAGGAGIETPPDAFAAVEGGDPVEGQLGTYVWAGGGSDSPWLPGAPIAAATGELLTVGLAPDLAVSDWSAVLAPADSPDGAGRVDAGSGPGALTITVPSSGAWTLALTARFGDLGSATWFWRLDVP